MKADLATRLRRSMRAESIPKTGVAGVTGVAWVSATCAKSLTLQWLRQLRLENDELANDVVRGVVRHVAVLNDPDQTERAAIGIAEIEVNERMGMAADCVPKPYLDAWARLQCQKPMRVSDEEWRHAIDDAWQVLRHLEQSRPRIRLDYWRSLGVRSFLL
jgi:hypothetical protein